MDEERKQCADCLAILSRSDFYQIRGSDEGRIRWEKVCKGCKRKRRKSSLKLKERSKGATRELAPALDVPKTSDNNIVDSVSQNASSETAPAVRLRADGQAIYKEYIQPSGEVLQLTKEEFDRVVDAFRMLWAQDQKKNPPAA